MSGWEPGLWFGQQPTGPHGVFPGTKVFVFIFVDVMILIKIVPGKSQTEVLPCLPLQFPASLLTTRDMATQMQPTLWGDTTIQGNS